MEEYQALIKALFDKCDTDGTGKLDFPQFEKFAIEAVAIEGKDE